MPGASSTNLDWVKPNQENVLIPVSGSLASPAELWGRSIWGEEPKAPFTLWEQRFAWRILRALGVGQQPMAMQIADSKRGVALSESRILRSPSMPGHGVYFFEDEHGNRSGPVNVTTASVAEAVRRIEVSGNVVTVGPNGVSVSLPLKGERGVKITHRLEAPNVDPEVRVTLLVPGADGESDLQRRVGEYLGSLELPERSRGALEGGDRLALMEELSGGFLPRDPGGWELALDGGERQRGLTVEPGDPQEVTVSIRVPEGSGRFSYALSIVEEGGDGLEVLSSIIELEAVEPDLVRVADDSLEFERGNLQARLLFAVLVELAPDDPDVSLWAAVLADDVGGVERALQRGADPNATMGAVLNRHRDLLREQGIPRIWGDTSEG